MSSVDRMLRRWTDEGLLDEATCLRLADYERGRRNVAAARPVLLELLTYLALVLASAGVVLLVGVNWEHMTPWTRVGVLAVPGLLILVAGRFLSLSAVPGLRRGGAMGWLLSLVLLTSSVGLAGSELGAEAETAALAAGMAALVLASVLWLLNRTHLQVFGLAAASLMLSIVTTVYWATSLSESNIVMFFGASMLMQFVGGAALVRLGFLRPKVTAGVLSLLGLACGSSAFSIGLSWKFSEFDAATVAGGSLMVFGLWVMVGARLRVLAPELLAGLLSELGYAVAAVLLPVGIAGEVGHSEATVAGALLIIIGATLITLTEVGVCAPRMSARVIGAAGLLAGAIAVSVPDGPVAAEALPLLLGAALASLSLNRRSFLYMAAGVVAAFIGLVTPVARHVGDPTVAASLMIGIGLTMLAVLALLARYRPWSRSQRGGTSTIGAITGSVPRNWRA